MAFTYTMDLTIPLDYLRFRLDDKEEEYRVYEDEELNYFINQAPASPTETDLDKIALRLLKKQLQELLRSPSRERAGNYEVYLASSQALSLAIKELEEDIRSSSSVKPYFGGVNVTDYEKNISDDSILQGKFRDGAIYKNSNEIDCDDFDGSLI